MGVKGVMEKKVLLIHKGSAMVANTLAASLKGVGIESARVEPEIERINTERESACVLVLLAGEFVYDRPEVLVYLKDLCFSDEKPLCIIGYEKELAEIKETIPKGVIRGEFLRPVDVKALTGEIRTLIHIGAVQKRENHILLVDDDTVFLQTMQGWLSQKYHVAPARSGVQAITFLSTHTPDLILLDYDMPVTPGPQVLEMIRSEPSYAHIPVIFLTGKNDRSSVERVMRLKPDGYLLKSMSREDILASVDRFFETRKWENLYQAD